MAGIFSAENLTLTDFCTGATLEIHKEVDPDKNVLAVLNLFDRMKLSELGMYDLNVDFRNNQAALQQDIQIMVQLFEDQLLPENYKKMASAVSGLF